MNGLKAPALMMKLLLYSQQIRNCCKFQSHQVFALMYRKCQFYRWKKYKARKATLDNNLVNLRKVSQAFSPSTQKQANL